MSKGKVVAGDYSGYNVIAYENKLFFMKHLTRISVDKSNVNKYEVIDNIEQTSYWGTVAKGIISEVFFGPAGLVATATSSIKKDVYLISIEFIDGKKSLIEVNNEEYKSVIKALF